jgi:hypothetical protein
MKKNMLRKKRINNLLEKEKRKLMPIHLLEIFRI